MSTPLAVGPLRSADDGSAYTDLGQMASAFMACPRLAALLHRVKGNEDFNRRGRQLVKSGLIELGPFAAVEMGPSWEWKSNPLNDRSWQWRLNWLSFLSYLVSYHSDSQDRGAMEMAINAATSWLDQFDDPVQGDDYEFAWHDHGTALRTEQMALLIHYMEREGLWDSTCSQEAKEQLLGACIKHAALLAREDFYSSHTNHGLEQTRVLLMIGLAVRTCLPGASDDWMRTALLRLDMELRYAFTHEGVHVENSPAYHAFVFKVFLRILEEFSDANLIELDTWRRETGPKALEFITHILRPDGLLPIIGDTEARPVTDTFKDLFGETDAYKEFLFVQSSGRKGRPPSRLHRVYPESGYAIFRSEWDTSDGFEGAFHMVCKLGASSRYHRQQDDGSIVVYNEGEDWIIDSGLYNYEKSSKVRKYMRSRHAHNVCVLDREVINVQAADPRASWHVVSFSEKRHNAFVCSESLAYSGVRMVRRVSLFRRRCFRIDDILGSLDGQVFTPALLWHIPIDKRVEIVSPEEVVVRSRRTKHLLRLRTQGDRPIGVKLRAGIVRDRVVSVVSKEAGSHSDSRLLSFHFAPGAHFFSSIEFTFETSS